MHIRQKVVTTGNAAEPAGGNAEQVTTKKVHTDEADDCRSGIHDFMVVNLISREIPIRISALNLNSSMVL